MRACYSDLGKGRKDELIASLVNSESLETITQNELLTLLNNTQYGSKLYNKCRDGVESLIQEKLLTTLGLESIFPDPNLVSYLILKDLLWDSDDYFVPGLGITLPSWSKMFSTVTVTQEEEFVLDDFGNKIPETQVITQVVQNSTNPVTVSSTTTTTPGTGGSSTTETASTISSNTISQSTTVIKTNPDGTYIYQTKVVNVLGGWITLYNGYGGRSLVYDVVDKVYCGITPSGTLRNIDSRTLSKIFSDQYCALI